MKSQDALLAEVQAAIHDIVDHEGLELVDVSCRREPVGWVLRVLVDRQPGGMTVDLCAGLSRQIGDVLEVKDFMPFAYRLEVSSPGVNRPLKNARDFETRIGQTVSITTRDPLDGRRHFKGLLSGFNDGLIEIAIENRRYAVPLAAVKKAHIEYDFSKDRQPKKKH